MAAHPLEPLSATEIQRSVELLKELPHLGPATRTISIMLSEPSKPIVYAWPNGPASCREAVAVLFDNAKNNVSTITLDLDKGEVLKSENGPVGAQPTLSIDEQVECEQAVLASEDFKTALKKHYGITDTSLRRSA
jgi:primary-amine oxidase